MSFTRTDLLVLDPGKIVLRHALIVHLPYWKTQVSPESNASLVMETLLLVSLLTCSDAKWIVEGVVNNSSGMSRQVRLEIITEIREASPEDCNILMGDSRYPDESTS